MLFSIACYDAFLACLSSGDSSSTGVYKLRVPSIYESFLRLSIERSFKQLLSSLELLFIRELLELLRVPARESVT